MGFDLRGGIPDATDDEVRKIKYIAGAGSFNKILGPIFGTKIPSTIEEMQETYDEVLERKDSGIPCTTENMSDMNIFKIFKAISALRSWANALEGGFDSTDVQAQLVLNQILGEMNDSASEAFAVGLREGLSEEDMDDIEEIKKRMGD